MQNILVPFDFSNESNAALRAAAEIASKLNSKIFLLNVYEAPEETNDMYSFSEEALMNYKKLIDEVKSQHEIKLNEIIEKSTFLNSEIEPVAKRGFVHKEIIEAVEELKIDLIVMGAKGTSSLEEYFIGTNVEKIIHNVDCPVLVIPHVQKHFTLEHLVFASGFNEDEVREFEFFKDLSVKFDSTVHLLRVNTPANFERSKDMRVSMEHFAKHWDLKKTTSNIYSDFSIEEGMLEFAKTMNADLICLHRRHHRSFFSFLNARFTDEIVKHSSTRPILILT
jgi:nucleotide-binding universal stress UspA family protein